MNPVPPQPDSAAQLYHGASGHTYHGTKRALRREALPWIMALRAEKFQRHVSPDATVFELGVGAGWNLGRLRCARKIGCDTAAFLAAEVSAWGIEFVTNSEMLPDATAQVAICHQTLEHLLAPAEALRQLGRILKPDGRLILHVPWERERRYARYRADEPNHHLYNWNAQNLGALVALCGFKIESVTTRHYGYDRFAANKAVQFGIGERGFRLLRAGLIFLRPLREVELIARRKSPATPS